MNPNPWKKIAPPCEGFETRLVGPAHPLNLYWGRDSSKRYLFIYKFTSEKIPKKKSLPRLAGIDIGLARESSGSSNLVLRLMDSTHWEIFHTLCQDIILATEDCPGPNEATPTIIQRLGRWQDLLRRGQLGILSGEQIRGLLSELLFLSDVVSPNLSWETAILSWHGPEGAPQDFAVEQSAIEVKCQSGSSTPTVRISSAEQLEPQLPKGYLVVFTMTEMPKGDHSLNSVIRKIRAELLQNSDPDTRKRFEELIYAAGYVKRDEYDDFRYNCISLTCFELREGFPRILSSSLASGVAKVTYNISLAECSPFEARPAWWSET